MREYLRQEGYVFAFAFLSTGKLKQLCDEFRWIFNISRILTSSWSDFGDDRITIRIKEF